MIEKIGPVKNPLTIIAVFAGLTEISGTAVLPFIAEINQYTYMWFLIIFPSILVLLFFLTLNFNHHVLYAPSDFRDEENYFKGLKSASPAEKVEKIKEEVREIERDPHKTAPERLAESRPTSSAKVSSGEVGARYILAERLVLDRLSKEYGTVAAADVRMSLGRRSIIFDGVISTSERFIVIEVKYTKHLNSIVPRLKDVIRKFTPIYEMFSAPDRLRFLLLLAIVSEERNVDKPKFKKHLEASLDKTPFPIEIRTFDFDELEQNLRS